MEEGWIDFLFAWAGTSICSCPQLLTFLVLWPLDMYWIIFPDSPACRGQIVALLGHHNFMSQLLCWINLPLSLFLQIYIYYWFCFSGESCIHTAAAAKSLQSCPTLCDPMDGSPPGSPVPRILQARTMEWVAISFSNAWKWKVKVKSLSRVRLLATPWTAAYQAPPSTGFSRQEYWSGVPLPSPAYILHFAFSYDSIVLFRKFVLGIRSKVLL